MTPTPTGSLPLLLLPGLTNDARVWDPVTQAIGSTRTVVVMPTHLADDLADLAADAIRQMPHGPFAVAGFSLGGYVALEICRQAGGRVAGLALLDTGAQADGEPARQQRQRMIDAVATGSAGMSQVGDALLARVLHPAHLGRSDLVERLRAMAAAVGRDGFVRQQRLTMSRPDSRDTLRAWHGPTLILCGQDDQVTPPALSQEMAALVDGDVDLVIVAEAGHMTTLEQPAAVVQAMQRWLGKVDRAAG